MSVRAWLHDWIRRCLFKLFVWTEPSRGTVNGASVVTLISWGWSEPGEARPGDPTPPLVVLQLQRASVLPRRPLQVLLSPAQAHQLCQFGLDGVERQRRLFHDAQPRELDTGNIRGVS